MTQAILEKITQSQRQDAARWARDPRRETREQWLERIIGAQPRGHLHGLGSYAITALYSLRAEMVGRYKLAEMNLISAYGLPGAEDLDIGQMLTTLDGWAEHIRKQTEKNLPRYHANPSKFNSLASFRITGIFYALIREFGVRYNPDRLDDPHVWSDPADSFIHGILGPKRTGTCSSLPVVITALGRKLGYPLKLVLAPGHVFCRWDAPDQRFNIEFNNEGVSSHDDAHYREWPVKWDAHMIEHEKRRPTHLISLTPPQDLALFAATRAHCLDAGGLRRQEAVVTMAVAYRLSPNNHGYGVWMNHLQTKAMFPNRELPDLPCEETAGPAAVRAIQQAGGRLTVSQ